MYPSLPKYVPTFCFSFKKIFYKTINHHIFFIGGGEMKLEDLEGHLNALKEMFIQKQKMMEELENVTADGAAPAAADPAAAAPAPPPAPEATPAT